MVMDSSNHGLMYPPAARLSPSEQGIGRGICVEHFIKAYDVIQE
ncbi:hypothetical protein HMPREF0908_1723 [Selenomonas flueggei ATCC 43531]|uniref:Uncharacterized protein n=1 Tax=Selenomonas flueggei ATCC 43531 TaxID=638302 RepID=C4V5C9_9FIRM|nr:hypothetical protein HMPREF0908_1723 [Selenomonas flueggei ATCC 43531]